MFSEPRVNLLAARYCTSPSLFVVENSYLVKNAESFLSQNFTLKSYNYELDHHKFQDKAFQEFTLLVV